MTGNITVQQLYEYAVQNNYLMLNAATVLDIMERNFVYNYHNDINIGNVESCPLPESNVCTVDFSTLIEYTPEDLLLLLSM